jgi:hypothetical protein
MSGLAAKGALKVRFTVTLGEEPEVELALLSHLAHAPCKENRLNGLQE